jgi:RNA polymerase sigma-70 factor, ECF subfamily
MVETLVHDVLFPRARISRVQWFDAERNGNKIEAAPVTRSRTSERWDVLEGEDRARFEALVLPHLDAAFNLALWMLRNPADAQDVTQEALLRAYRFFHTFRTGNARAWLLQIVRNSCYTWLRKKDNWEDVDELEEGSLPAETCTPETLAIASGDRQRLAGALEKLPASFREVLVLRELEGCSYKEIAAITGRPLGTVMSALARARRHLRDALVRPSQMEAHREL